MAALGRAGSQAIALVEATRPKQWVKNLFVAFPLVFSKHLTHGPDALRCLLAVATFCALSGAVYLRNDVIDLEKDRAHPTKRRRPIAAGRLPVATANAAAAVLAALAVGAGTWLGLGFVLCAAAYLLNNVAYNLWLKRMVYVDVLSISAGFLVRVAAGAFAINVEASPYLLICTGLVSCFLGFGKRSHELRTAGEQARAQRPVLDAYRADVLRVALAVTGVLSFAAYLAYLRAPHTLAFFGTGRLVWTIPFAGFALFRFHQLVSGQPGSYESPTDALLHDWPFVTNFALWGAAVVGIIYFR